MTQHQIQAHEDLAAALAADRFLLFKHSPRCPYSRRAFKEYAAFVDEHPGIAHGWIDVVEQPDWSRRVEAEVGIRHESPQALLLMDGRVSWHASHGSISKEALEAAL